MVIDLAAANDRLLPPQRHAGNPKPEDRLFVPSEYVPITFEIAEDLAFWSDRHPSLR